MDRPKHCIYLVIVILEEVCLINIWLSLVMLLWRLLITRLCFQANWPSFRGCRGYMQNGSEEAWFQESQKEESRQGNHWHRHNNKQRQKLRVMCRSVDTKSSAPHISFVCKKQGYDHHHLKEGRVKSYRMKYGIWNTEYGMLMETTILALSMLSNDISRQHEGHHLSHDLLF